MTNNISILISHDSSDEKIAIEVKNYLENVFLNVSAFVSGRDTIGGQIWIEQIKSKMKLSSVIISLISNKSLNNNWVHFESGAGFIEDKTIPLLTGNLRLEYLSPPMSLLQGRLLTVDGIELFIKDISRKIGVREPQNYPSINDLVTRINKLVRKGNTLILDNITPLSLVAPSAIKKWIWSDTFLVFDYLLENKYEIAVDTVFDDDKVQILLFDRSGSKDYIYSLCNSSTFLPKSIMDEEWQDHKLIYHTFNFTTRIETIADTLIDLLSKIEKLKNE